MTSNLVRVSTTTENIKLEKKIYGLQWLSENLTIYLFCLCRGSEIYAQNFVFLDMSDHKTGWKLTLGCFSNLQRLCFYLKNVPIYIKRDTTYYRVICIL